MAQSAASNIELVVGDQDSNEYGHAVYFHIRFCGKEVPYAGPEALDEGLMLSADEFEAFAKELKAKVIYV